MGRGWVRSGIAISRIDPKPAFGRQTKNGRAEGDSRGRSLDRGGCPLLASKNYASSFARSSSGVLVGVML